MSEVKIYKVGDYDYVAARNELETKQVMADIYSSGNLAEYENDYDDLVIEMTIEEINRFTFLEDDDSRKSFREKLDELILTNQEFPVFFASENQ